MSFTNTGTNAQIAYMLSGQLNGQIPYIPSQFGYISIDRQELPPQNAGEYIKSTIMGNYDRGFMRQVNRSASQMNSIGIGYCDLPPVSTTLEQNFLFPLNTYNMENQNNAQLSREMLQFYGIPK
jgi:hypothetical protein